MSNEVRSLLGRAITRLLAGHLTEFKKLATIAEENTGRTGIYTSP